MRHGSLFSGIGGADLAAQWMGWENVFSCEINPFGRKILEYYWPNTAHYEDINKTDFTIWRGRVDIITGGFPCQGFSLAGKRKGTEDDRHLWPRMFEVIKDVQPTWIVGENVFGIVGWDGGVVFEQVCLDLEAAGYEVQPVILPAVAVNAPHRRDRVWFIAKRIASDSNGIGGCARHRSVSGANEEIPQRNEDAKFSNSDTGTAPYTDGLRGRKEHELQQSELHKQCGEGGFASDTNNERLEGQFQQSREAERTIRKERQPINSLNNRSDTWDNFPTQSPVCGRDDGIPRQLDSITFSKWRNESIKGFGNAWVPQVAYEIFKVIEEMNKNYLPPKKYPALKDRA
ncbi:MAG: DNA (cytosine-5-)-methyltransferase [Anaerovoracaceae bacterium]